VQYASRAVYRIFSAMPVTFDIIADYTRTARTRLYRVPLLVFCQIVTNSRMTE